MNNEINNNNDLEQKTNDVSSNDVVKIEPQTDNVETSNNVSVESEKKVEINNDNVKKEVPKEMPKESVKKNTGLEESFLTSGSDKKDDEEIDSIDGEKRFPFAIVIILVVIILVAILYYSFWLTSERVFDKAVNNIVDSIEMAVNSLEYSTHKNMNVDIQANLTSNGPYISDESNIEFLDGLEVNADVNIDNSNLDLGLHLYSNLEKVSDRMTYGENLDFSVDYVKDNFFLKLPNKVAKIDINNKYKINYSKLNDAVGIFKDMKDQVLILGEEKLLDKSITTKKVNNQTAIAIRVNVKLNKNDIENIYKNGFTTLYYDNDFISKLSNVFSITELEAKDMIESILKRDVKTNNIEINLYMNLANTQLIGFDVVVDNYYFELSYINNNYYIDAKIYDDDMKNELLDISAYYDNYYGVLDLIGDIELKDQTYLYFETQYKRKTSDDSLKITGNVLNIKLYDEKSLNSNSRADKPFCILDCSLDITYDNDEIKFVNPEEATDIVSLEDNDIKSLSYLMDKLIYEYNFAYGRLMLNRKDSEYVKKYINDKSLYSKKILSSLIVNSIGSISYDDLIKMSSNEIKEKLYGIKDMSEEQRDLIFNSIVNNIILSFSFDELDKLSYEEFSLLIKDKLSILDVKYRDSLYNGITDMINNYLTYDVFMNFSIEKEKSLINKLKLLPEVNMQSIFNHLVDEIGNNINNIVNKEDLFEKIGIFPDKYKSLINNNLSNLN